MIPSNRDIVAKLHIILQYLGSFRNYVGKIVSIFNHPLFILPSTPTLTLLFLNFDNIKRVQLGNHLPTLLIVNVGFEWPLTDFYADLVYKTKPNRRGNNIMRTSNLTFANSLTLNLLCTYSNSLTFNLGNILWTSFGSWVN